jgi:WD40 repeat protein/tRNA A-37 threonylcarbamoyl transferase component Bud32
MAQDRCIGDEELRQLLAGTLPESLVQAITRHVEDCTACEARACALDEETSPFVRSLRQAVRLACAEPDATAPSLPTRPSEWPIFPAGYEILSELGRGGMSVVYQARQRHPARIVALKLLLGERHAGPEHHARFRAEADALARLQHPHIVQVFDLGQDEGIPFLVLEYMAGGSLAQRVGAGPQSARSAAELVECLALAVQHAHAHGVIHRDLKPANVLLTEDGTPKISDFGLAKQERPDLTATGAVLGTPSYMAPEQAAGASRTVGPGADVYALGAILYELLTGRPPFRAATVLETLDQVRVQEPVPPSQLQPGTPRDLSVICLKCLHKEPARRYASAQALAADLRRFLKGRPILARPVGGSERVWRWARRNPGWATMFVSVATLLVFTALATSLLSLRALRAEARTEEKLFESRLAEARALTLSRRPGQHFASLALLDEARALARKLGLPAERWHELRNATVAALALPDLYPERTWDGFPEGSAQVSFDERLELYARTDQWGNCSVRRVDDDQELYALPAPQPGPPKGVGVPSLSPNGRYLAVRQVDGRLHVWKLDSARPELWLRDESVHWLNWRPDSVTVGWTYEDGSVSVYDVASRRRLARLSPNGLTRGVALALHPSEPLVALTSYFAHEAQVRDLRNGNLLRSLSLPHGGILVGWDPSGQTLAASEGDAYFIHLYDRATFAERLQIGPTEAWGTRFFFNHAGDCVAVYTWRSAIELHDALTGQKLISVPFLKPVEVLRFSPDDTRLAGFARAGRLGIWRVANHPVRRTLARSRSKRFLGESRPAVSPDGRLVAMAMMDGIAVWDLQTGRELAFLPFQREGQSKFVLFEPGPPAALVTGTGAGTYRWPLRPVAPDHWRLGPPQALALPPGRAAGYSRDGRVLATGVRAVGATVPWGGAWVWHADHPDRPVHLAAGNSIAALAVSPDGRWLATADRGRLVVELWDAQTGKLVQKLLDVFGIPAFSPDGAWLAVGPGDLPPESNEAPGRLFATDTWQAVRPLDSAAVFTPDGRTLILGNGTSAFRFVETRSGRELVRIENPDVEQSWPSQLTPDGTRLIMPDDDTDLHVWDLRRLRAELATRDLDWDAPPFGPEPPPQAPVTLEVDWGDYERLGQQELARNYDRAVEAAPQRGERWYYRGIFHWRAGRHAQALADLRKAAELEPKRARFCHALARLYALAPEPLRDAAQALTLAERAVQRQPGDWLLEHTRGVALYRAGRTEEAITVLQRSLKGGGGQLDALNLYFLALCHHRLGHSQKARDCFRQAAAWRQAHGELKEDWVPDLDTYEAEARAVLGTSPPP